MTTSIRLRVVLKVLKWAINLCSHNVLFNMRTKNYALVQCGKRGLNFSFSRKLMFQNVLTISKLAELNSHLVIFRVFNSSIYLFNLLYTI